MGKGIGMNKYMIKHKKKGYFQGFYGGILIFSQNYSVKGLGIWPFTKKDAEEFIEVFGKGTDSGMFEILSFDEELHEQLKKSVLDEKYTAKSK